MSAKKETTAVQAALWRVNRNPTKKKFSNVFLVGNGAIIGGADPLSAWLKRFDRDDGPTFFGLAPWSHALSVLSMHLKIYRKQAQDPDGKHHRKLEELIQYKAELAAAYQVASGDGTLKRHDLSKELESVFYNPDTLVITTNWDTVIWDDNRLQSVVQLHGSCLHPNTMVFPTEVLLDYMDGGKSNEFFRIPTPDLNDDERTALGTTHRLSMEGIEGCKRLYIWGLAINDYDAEIITILSFAMVQGGKKSLYVINPNGDHGVRAAGAMQLSEFCHVDPCSGFTKTRVGLQQRWQVESKLWTTIC